MKKLLFTLCAVLAGFAANAVQLEAKYVYNNADVENNEITVTPGQTARIFVNVTNMVGVVEGLQVQWTVKDVAGNVYDYPAYGTGENAYTPETAPKVNLKLTSAGKAFTFVGMSKLGGFAESVPGDGTYRIIAAQIGVGAVWIGSVEEACEFFNIDEELLLADPEEVDGGYGYTRATFTQGNVIRFDIQTDQYWNEEYATLDFDQEYDKVSWHGEAAGKLGLPDLKIKNANWQAPLEDLTGEIVISEPDENGQVTVTYTGNEDVTITVNGQPYTGPIQLEDGVETTIDVTVSADGYNDLTDSKDLTWNKPTVATPVITFNETKDGEVVTAVTVQIENWTSATINGEEFTNTRGDVKTFTANYTEDQEIVVTAENVHADYPEVTATAEDTYTLKKLEKKNVPAPEVTPQTGDDAVTLNITWPESDGTHVIKVDGQESTETSFPRQDADYTVDLDIYVTAGATCNESAHYTQTITIPKKVTTPTEQTGQPTFHESFKPNHNAVYITIDNAETEPNATIFYQITYPDGTTSGWLEYTPGQEIAIFGPNEGGQQGTHVVEAYAVAPGKLPSETIKLEPSLGPTTGIDELIDGKAIANVRYFNMAGQEMQEANGMTIVVTTYTDGTTSAVKVMK